MGFIIASQDQAGAAADRPLIAEETAAALLERESHLDFEQVDEDALDYDDDDDADDLPEDTAAWEMAIKLTDRRFAGYIYFIQNPELGAVKIGLGIIMRRRLASIQDSNPRPVILLRAIPVLDCVAADLAARRHFAAKVYRDEWFTLTAADIAGYTP